MGFTTANIPMPSSHKMSVILWSYVLVDPSRIWIWRITYLRYAPNSYTLIQVCDWLKSYAWVVECTRTICCEECKVPTYSSLQMSLKSSSFHLGRPTCHGVSNTTIPRDLLDKSPNSYVRYLWQVHVLNHVMFRSNQVAAIYFGGTWIIYVHSWIHTSLCHIPSSKYKDVC